jgi:uncharacterized protein (DUF488 family)
MVEPITSTPRIWTIGHSTRSIDDFVDALAAHGIRQVADVRLLPGSKRYPHFNNDALAASLTGAGIGYEHFASSEEGESRGRIPPHRLAKRRLPRLCRPHGQR